MGNPAARAVPTAVTITTSMGVKPQDEAHDDDGHPDERPQIDVTKHVDP